MSTNDKIEDAVTRHQVLIMRYAKGREDIAEEYIASTIEAVGKILGPDIASVSTVRLDEIILEILKDLREKSASYEKDVVDEMLEFVGYQADFNVNVFSANVDADIASPILSILQSAMLLHRMPLESTRSYTVNEALQEFSTRKSRQIVQTIRDGVTLGQTSAQISGNVRELAGVQKRQAATLARTISNYVSIQAREVVMNDNRNITDSYKWIATLDSRTSLICGSRDQQIYKEGPESPKPPAHFNCRSTIAPVVKEEFDLGLGVVGKRAAVSDTGITRIAGDTPYEAWLKRQSLGFQVEVLGASRAKLFRDGKISIGRFVDQNGRTLTLDQLRKLEPVVFEDLGI